MAKTYKTKDGQLVEQERSKSNGSGLPFGGMGLYSTIGDYARFAQMLLNGGQLDGVRILGRKTVEPMTANHLNYLPKQTIGEKGAEGFGLGGAVRIISRRGTTSAAWGSSDGLARRAHITASTRKSEPSSWSSCSTCRTTWRRRTFS